MGGKTKGGLSADQVVEQVIANSRIEGLELDDETIDVVRKIASGEMTGEEADAWSHQRALNDVASSR